MSSTTSHIVISVVGFIGLSGFISAIRSSRKFSRHQRFLRLRTSESADMVLTTSARVEGGFHIRYLRSVTAVGNLRAATEIAQSIGYRSAHRPVKVSVSAEIETPLSGDLVVIGLPGKNAVSAMILAHLTDQYPNLGLVIEETDAGCGLQLGQYSASYEVRLQPESHYPTNDLAVVVMWVNPLTVRKRRLVWCGGFTAYGTAAAASYLVDRVLTDRLARLREEHKTLPSLWSRKWICFAMVVEIKLVHDQVVEVAERAFVPLEDPGRPPFKNQPAPAPATVAA